MSAGPEIPFTYVHHLLTVPVVVDGSRRTRFVLDTGIGLNLVSPALADELGYAATGETYTGRRMSGQEVTLQLTRLHSLAFGNVTAEDVEAGLFDLSALPPDFEGVEGFLSLAYFAARPFTVDYPRGVVVIETEGSLAARWAGGTVVPVRIDDDGHSVCAFLPLTIPGGNSIEVEVDTGSDALILNAGLAESVGVDLEADGVRLVEGEDETSNAYARYFTRLAGDIHLTDAPGLRQPEPEVMFQRIIHEGLVGDAFLRRFVVTYDVSRGEMILASQA